MRRQAARLSDGRDIFYYNAAADAVRELHDKRGLAPVVSSSQARWDPTVEEWVVIASHRQDRTFLPSSDDCPLCPSREDHLTEIPSTDYDVVVFENRFPSLAVHAVPPSPAEDTVPELAALVARRPATGRCEVVCFTPVHDASFSTLRPAQVCLVMEAWADRTRELSALPEVEQVFAFENRGEEIGVTLDHPHGQIYAYPFLTPRTRRKLAAASRYRHDTGRALYDDLLAAAVADGRRVVASSCCWVAFVPAAARWPFEVHLYPRRRTPDLPSLTQQEREDFGGLYLQVLGRLDGLFGLPMPYVAAWHQAPVRTGRHDAALHLELFSSRRSPDKLKYLAGSESGMDVFINDVVPEQAADMLRASTPTVVPVPHRPQEQSCPTSPSAA